MIISHKNLVSIDALAKMSSPSAFIPDKSTSGTDPGDKKKSFARASIFLIFLLSLFIFSAGCGGGGGSDVSLPPTTGNASDTTQPTVLAVSPTDTGVVLNTTITATFSTAMDDTTLNTATFTVSTGGGNISGTVAYSDTTATFIPSADLASNTSYSATIAAGVKDLAGNPMLSSYSWSFKTGTTSDITAPTDPTGLTATAISSSQINLSWTASTDSGGSGLAGYTIERCSGAGCTNFTLIATTTLTTYSNTGLTASASYSYQVRAYDNAGNNSGYSNTASATTPGSTSDTTAPTNTTATNFINSGATYTTSTSVTLSISSTDSVGVTGYYASESSTAPTASATGWTAVASTTSYSANVSFTLSSTNGTKTVYVWFKDGAGNVSTSVSDSITLDTTAPTVLSSSISPSNGAINVSVNPLITATFSETMDGTTFTSATFTLTSGAGAVSGIVSFAGDTATFTPSGSLAFGTSYTVTITTGVKDLAGNQMASNYTWTFTTGDTLPTPVIFYTDITSGPNTGGENNNGTYLSVFGKNFGSSGPGSTVKVYINNVEVDNYRYLGVSKGRQDIQQITVQIGAVGNPTPGVVLPIKVVVNGVASNTDKTFTVNPGTIYFVSLSGDDATGVPGDIARPYRTVQKPGIGNNGGSGCPIASGDEPVATAGVWGLVHPGDVIVMRGGTWTDVGRDDFFLRVQNKSGSIPTGEVGTGPITLMGYPNENVFINRTNLLDNQPGGGISSADSARQALGCGALVTLSNLKVESGFADGMIATQRGVDNPDGSYWRVVNNEMTAVSCQNNTKCKGGGVSGSGLGEFWVGNYVHDVYDKPDGVTDNENHGFYIDGSGTYEIAYNRIENIYGGNGIQAYSSNTRIDNVSIHHNVINGTSKHGLNIGDTTGTGFVIYNNLVYNTDVAGLRFNTTDLSGAKIYNNTFFKTDRLNIGGIRAALMNDAILGPGALDMRNNIIIPGSASHEYVGGSVDFGGTIGTFSNNLWFNGTGDTIVGSGDQNGDPKFVSIVSGAENFHLQAGGAAQDAGTAAVASLVTDDYDTTPRPQGGLYDIGAFEFW